MLSGRGARCARGPLLGPKPSRTNPPSPPRTLRHRPSFALLTPACSNQHPNLTGLPAQPLVSPEWSVRMHKQSVKGQMSPN